MRREAIAMFTSSTPATGHLLRRFLHDESGATAIEYAMIASGVSIAIVGTVAGLGTAVKGFYTTVASALK